LVTWRIAGGESRERRLVTHGEMPHVDLALLRSLIRRRRVHRHPQLATGDPRVSVGEAAQGASIVGFDINGVPPAAAAQIPEQGGIAPELSAQRKAANLARAPRELEIDAAQGFAIKAGDRAEFDIEIEVGS